jgi:hypothetical protein
MNLIEMIKEHPNIQLSVGATELKEFARDIISEFMEGYQTPKDEDTLFTPEQAAAKIQTTKVTLWRWAKQGYLSPIRVGGKVFYKESDIKKLMEG